MGETKGIGEAILGGLPIIGGIASSLLARKWAVKDRDAQNEYNSPANQLRLLKEAGLPAVSYFGQGASAQSEQPRQVNPEMGSSEVFEKMAMNQIHKKQLQIMDADIRMKNAEANLKEEEANFMLKPQSWQPRWAMDEAGDYPNVQSRLAHRLGVDMKKGGIALIEQRERARLLEKYQDGITLNDLNSGKLEVDLKRLDLWNYNDQSAFRRNLAYHLRTNKKMSLNEMVRTIVGMKQFTPTGR